MENKWIGVICLVIISRLNITLAYNTYEDIVTKANDEKPRVEMRAVFINCEPEDSKNASPDSDAKRFERGEQFKHSALKDCNKKLALTLKMISEIDNSGDEYLPIEHVFEGPNKKRVRLLDPYILRLQRDVPLQAYKLRRLETVSGVLLNSAENVDEKRQEGSRNRLQRDLEDLSEVNDSKGPQPQKRGLEMHPEIAQEFHQLQPPSLSTTELVVHELKEICDKNHVWSSLNNTLYNRYKRSEHNIVVETVTDSNTKWISKNVHRRILDRDRNKYNTAFEDEVKLIDDSYQKSIKLNHKKEPIPITKHTSSKNTQRKHRSKIRTVDSEDNEPQDGEFDEDTHSPRPITNEPNGHNTSGNKNGRSKQRKSDYDINSSNEIDYAVYEIGSPALWHIVHIQLFQKLSTSEGKTVWNDLTKGKLASVSSVSPEYATPDLNVRYRSAKWVPREEFTLPSTRLCLLVPINDEPDDSFADNGIANNSDTGYFVMPEGDIEDFNKEAVSTRSSDGSKSPANSSESIEQKHRKVIVRAARAVLKGNEDNMNITFQGTERYLTLKHRRPHSAQIELEARADENELVRVGSSGRISIAVADSTRRTRTILNLQIGNTGLAAARFRVAARDFEPILSDLIEHKGATVAGPILIPPRHTRSLRLELPVEIPVDVAHCSVTLLNEDDQAIAVRDVAIKKGDRCFCVWHCDCVCLSDDPRLMCRDMEEAAQQAAGLSTSDRTRHTRSVCYANVVTLNLFVIFTGVILFLLVLGMTKAILGLMCRCIATWGLHRLLQTPRKLDCYYEKSLKHRPVQYDKDGWPVHPDTKQRTVRHVSMPMELFLNTIFFISMPCLLIYEALKSLLGRVSTQRGKSCEAPQHFNTANRCYSSHDIQTMVSRQRRRRLRRWMTPQAQDLSKQLWQKSFNMQPLLRVKRDGASHVTPDSLPDSEQDDTDYVLTQMQKSRESLARTNKKMNELDPSAITTSDVKDQDY